MIKRRGAEADTVRTETVDTRIWRAEELGEAMLLRGSFTGFAYDLHTHDTACFALLTRGSILIRMPHREFEARTGDLYAIDAGVPHTGWPVDEGGWSLRTLYIDSDQLAALTGEETPPGSLALSGPIIQDRALTETFQALHRSTETGAPVLPREELLQAFIQRLFDSHARKAPRLAHPGREDKAILRARTFLEHRLDERVRLAEISRAAELPPFRLYRAFIRATGMSPHTYQRQARIHHAAKLIRAGHPLCEAASASGFADQAHMTRSFRRSMGITPGMYQEAARRRS